MNVHVDLLPTDSEVVMSAPFRWAVLGPGSIARRFAGQLPFSEHGVLAGVGSRDPERARGFAHEHELHHPGVVIGSYEEILASPDIDAVYVATVHTAHAALTIAALGAGKHVLCEKPLAPNHGTAMAMADAARRSGSTLLEAFMYRFHPQIARVLELVAEGAIGELVHVDASFAFDTGRREGRLFDPATAGGGILDVGTYPLSLARLVAGAAAGTLAAEPTVVRGAGTLGPTGVDEWATAQLTFPSGATATLRTGVRQDDPRSAVITGSAGVIRLEDPWALGDRQLLVLERVGQERVEEDLTAPRPYAAEADALARVAGQGEVPELPLEFSLGQARALDRWRAAIGLRYPFEREDGMIPTVTGRPLALPAGELAPAAEHDTATGMRYGTLPGVDKPLSRLVMGCDNQPDLAHASALFDAFVESGGTVFDSAYVYGAGLHEAQLGQWIANRGVREDVVVITKGAHTPSCDPESLTRQLHESLERQQTDYADLYMLHRDNLEVPVGEFVDVLDEHVRAGRIRAVGVSNWTLPRIDEARHYAASHGRHGIDSLSNHFGLAEALDVPWAGCVQVTDPASQRWLAERKLPIFPWSSQARGFFTGRAHPEDRSDAELVRCYYSEGNFERLERARALAAEHGVPATAIALAYVLAQPFPTFPLFGPRSITEMRSSMQGLGVELTPEQVAWLDLRGERP